jgi:hypothetical protein
MSKLIRVNDDVWEKLNSKALEHNLSIGRMVESLVNGGAVSNPEPAQPTQDLVDQLDEAAEAVDPLIADLPQGELPPCCQTIFDDPEHPTPTCPHWKKAWVYHYGNRIVHYKNTLTGGSYFDYFNKYVGA